MRRLSLLLLFLGGLTSPAQVFAQKEFGFDNRKPSGQPYWKAEETVAKFKVAPEFEVKLFAGEPQVVNPIAFTIDEKGRVWLIECFDYPKRAGKNVPRDRIVILEDTDGDGVCDKRTVFAEGKHFPVTEERQKAGLGAFDMASGIEVGHGGVFVGAPPYLFFIENKDDKPGKFEVLLKGFGSQDTHETLNTFQWGPDGWLYGLHGIFTNSSVKPGQLDGPEARINGGIWRYHPTQKKFEIFAEGTSNPWGMDWRNTDGQFILACCVIPHLFHISPGGIYKRQAGASFNPYAYSYLNEICDHTFHKESGWAHAGLISLDVPHMPEKYRNSVIFGSIHGCSIKQNVLKPNGSSFTASRADDFLVSGDKNFRPINMKWGPNGDIYLIDWHDQNPCHQTNADDWDYERGRVYRIQLKGTKEKKAEDLGKKTEKDWFGLARKSTNPWEYRTSLRLLSELNDLSMGGIYDANGGMQTHRAALMTGAMQRSQKLDNGVHEQYYRTVAQLKGVDPATLALIMRTFMTRVEVTEKQLGWLRAAAEDASNIGIHREIASGAIRLAEKHDVSPILHELMKHKGYANDPVIPQLVWLAYEKVLSKPSGGREPPVREEPRGADAPRSVADELAWLAEQSPENPFVREQIVPKVMRRLVATGKAGDLKLCIDFVAKVKDSASRERALEGLTIALKGQSVDAPPGWAALEKELRGDRVLLGYVNQLAVAFRDPAAITRAFAAARNDKLAAEKRVEAVRQIGVLKPDGGAKVLVFLAGTDAVASVRAESLRALSSFDDPLVPTTILGLWKDLPKELRGEAVNTLASRKEWAKALLTAMAEKKVDRTAVTDNTILRIQAFKDKELDTLIEKAWGRTRSTPKELNDLIDKTRASLHDAPASFARGKLVFENTCGKCHKFDGKGADVGPALDGAARDIEYILVNVIDPNRVIGAPYFVRTARLLDDTVFQGLLAEEDDKTITLKIENAVLKKIKKEDLNGAVQVSEKSLMPEGLGYNMTPQDFRDLVRYVMANPFLTEVTVNGEKKSFGAPGRIVLPDTKGGPAVVEAEVNGAALKTKLLVGSSADYEVRLNGKVVGSGKGIGKEVRPDQDGFEVSLPEGKNTVAIVVKNGGGVVFARFADPDRKLRYLDAGEKK